MTGSPDNIDYGQAALGFLIIGVVIALYFVPSLVAYVRGHRQRVAIFVLNLLLGWTFLGWVVALVWSLTNDREITRGDFAPGQTVVDADGRWGVVIRPSKENWEHRPRGADAVLVRFGNGDQQWIRSTQLYTY